MKISHIAWSKTELIPCISCKKIQTSWQDGVCSMCTVDVPKHIPYSQHVKWYKIKKEKLI